MTQEDKELLIKELCARLPYGVKAKYYGSAEECECWDTIEGIYPMDDEIVIGQYGLSVDKIKPYLFPLSSMTEEQKDEYHDNCNVGLNRWGDEVYYDCVESIDWLNAHYFDYRGLIPKGLAIDATGLNIY
jgi:hypothetical protein